ncbi:hypothetical protein OQJ19_01450 [Fluoribacter gormanii]|uniref:hypothetical protein n=1 Tax=Fluoribacter gormanii TaxID=464 RepID=UPI0010418B41|nr:hypothetical protein [Fluoribacter gormanii]MCW8469327.1 hypothetical protein [Fluoribacter gormanii]
MSREKIHQEIAKILNKKMEEQNLKGEWITNANGVTLKIAKEDYESQKSVFKDLVGAEVPIFLYHDIKKTPTYTAQYTSPSDLIKLLNKLGESAKAEEYQKEIEEENRNVVNKLKKLMKDAVQWESNIDGVFFSATLEIDRDKSGNETRREIEDYYKSIFGQHEITVRPEVYSAKEINSDNKSEPKEVRMTAGYSSGTHVKKLNEALDEALASEKYKVIAEILNKKMKEQNLKGEWITNSNGVTLKIAKEDYESQKNAFKDLVGAEVPIFLYHDKEKPPTYTAQYTSPSDLIKLLNKLGESAKAEEYQKEIEEENRNVVNKLKELMKDEAVQWESNVDGIFFSATLEIDRDKSGNETRREIEDYYKSIFGQHEITVRPEVYSAKEINSDNKSEPQKVRMTAGYSSGAHVKMLNKALDEALSSGVTKTKNAQFKARYSASISREEPDHSELLSKITSFCDKHSGVDGLEKMKNIINLNSDPQKALEEMIELAKWKKSDWDFTRKFHKNRFGRAPEVEDFYQELAKLQPNNSKSVGELMNFLIQDKTPENDRTDSFGYP